MARGAKPGERPGGRKKGTPNKLTRTVMERVEALGVDPIAILAYFADGDTTKLGYTGKGDPPITREMRLKAAIELAQYIAPKRKAIELSDPDGIAETFASVVKGMSQ